MKIRLLVSALLVILAGCSSSQKSETAFIGSSNAMRNKQWRLVTLSRYKLPALTPEQKPYLRFSRDTVYGFAGCNTFSALITSKGNRLNIGRPMSTLMACDNMDLENAFHNMLQQTTALRLANNSLYLLNGDSALAIFQ